ncbi:MAG: NADH-quinone oxidoreductase subunit H [Gammaproteobacteria bacterium]|jgi:formate hydrogenlyase subunit 4|nr:NADH-quinone oxidoreductase subunit H [Gammaproteobacteria bacterium]
MALIPSLALQFLQMLLVVAVAPLIIGITRKTRARLLRRTGAPVLQPYRDLARLLRKEALVAETASPLFRVYPYVAFGATWVAAALVPTFATGLLFSWSGDFIAIIALIGTGRATVALAGLDAGTSFGGIGSSREAMIAALAEPAMLMVVFIVALLSGTSQLTGIAAFMASPEVGLRVSLALGLTALVMVAIAENGRIPVDNPATHLELTMVHEAMVLEYAGRHLLMIELAAALKLIAYLAILSCVFLPFGLADAGAGAGAVAVGIAAFLAKLTALAALLAVFETSIAKMRVFRVPEFLGAALMLGLLGTLLLFVSRMSQ